MTTKRERTWAVVLWAAVLIGLPLLQLLILYATPSVNEFAVSRVSEMLRGSEDGLFFALLFLGLGWMLRQGAGYLAFQSMQIFLLVAVYNFLQGVLQKVLYLVFVTKPPSTFGFENLVTLSSYWAFGGVTIIVGLLMLWGLALVLRGSDAGVPLLGRAARSLLDLFEPQPAA
ncbi:hypothetical protein Ocepr_0486 [Oceanithermus profundus DSM 14977]|uniref:Uncharacterized protein n=1 Tax=Oceanithermus profundus (strain DSM 14977 / NBRC 100410 / VKM B-2274 / 506) TaxID=670487 RepID=E4U672_OCEP5|nr:hypothetical protein [Oceanithermus profundus]ADR35945.1 hypothetical protein Ocepr_0486 [Oceanithermus profundus DSM 14977]